MDSRSPLLRALNNMAETLPMHMPGHKRNPCWGSSVLDFAAKGMYDLDFTEVFSLDDLHAPDGIIAEAQNLAAACFNARHTFFLVNGATVGITAAIMACCKEGDKVLVPRNAHRCVYEAMVLSGASPVYFQPEYNLDLSVPLSPRSEQINGLISRESPQALVLVHPTYHGAGCDLALIEAAQKNNLFTIVDESHGSHFSFDHRLPMSALEAGADIVVHSTHKTLGSLTQTGLLHLATDRVDPGHMAGVLSLLQTTSPSYPLMASLDVMRADLALEGSRIIGRTVDLALGLRTAISQIQGFFCGELNSNCGYDPTKILLRTSFMNGFKLGETLRRDYGIYPETEEKAFVLLMLTLGDTPETIERLITALREIEAKHDRDVETKAGKAAKCLESDMVAMGLPEVALSPRQAFQAAKRKCKLKKAVGQISGSLVVPYPPGVPLLCPGEGISREIVEYLYLIAGNGAHVQGLSRNGGDLELLVLEC